MARVLKLVIKNLRIPVEDDRPQAYLNAAAEKMEVSRDSLSIIKILSKSPDYRDQDQFYYNLSLVVRTNESFGDKQQFQEYREPQKLERQSSRPCHEHPIIVGFGPAGMFAALELIAYGHKPLIFERGKKIEERSVDVQLFIRERKLNPESNIQFGEGGAGSYSDGKLFSRRANNTSYVNKVLKTFVKFGAPPEIEYISKPHLGTDVLCRIVRNIRLYILERGGEIHYSSKMTDILKSRDKVSGIVINGEKEVLSPVIFLALGHSARDTFTMLHQKDVALEQRQISVGVRIEHPAETINLMRYGPKYNKFPALGAATYSLNHTNRKIKRGVYTFCMCPGGEVVNASSEEGQLVLNGMSYSHRSSPFSNAALVVSCHPSDYPSNHPLAGIAFQEEIERKTYANGGGAWKVPAQNVMHFLGDGPPFPLNDSSYKMGIVPADMNELFPEFITRELQVAFNKWKEEVPLFFSDQAVLLGSETRTSSPVRVTRNENFESITLKNLYPIGEGSGYTGGITSSAADAITAVQKYCLS